MIQAGHVLVNGSVRHNVVSLVGSEDSVAVRPPKVLRGTIKLGAALDELALPVVGCVAVDLGASAGGFTTALLAAGAARVYAVDAGHGQLRGSLRQDPRVVNLEATNLAELTPELIPERADVIVVDLSLLALSDALPQIPRFLVHAGTRLLALVKPMYELHRGSLPETEVEHLRALDKAAVGAQAGGWSVDRWIWSPVPGSRGAREFFLLCRPSLDQRDSD